MALFFKLTVYINIDILSLFCLCYFMTAPNVIANCLEIACVKNLSHISDEILEDVLSDMM